MYVIKNVTPLDFANIMIAVCNASRITVQYALDAYNFTNNDIDFS